MLQAYANQTDVPEALREHYSKREDGKWHADIPDDHPAVKHNAKLLSEKQGAESKVTQLTSDLEGARAGNLGRGQVAMAKSDVDRLAKFDALGTPDEVGAIKTEHATLKEKDVKRTREDSLRQLAKSQGYNEEAFVRLPNLPDFINKPSKDGKSVEWFAQLKDDKGVITEKPAKEFVESSEDIKPFLPSLTQKSDGVRVPTTGPTTGVTTTDTFANAKKFGEQWNEQAKAGTDVAARFGYTN